MIRFAALLTVFGAGMAQAHPGHLAEVAGHGHWLAAGALAAAAALAALMAAKLACNCISSGRRSSSSRVALRATA